jgi:hypothetical protein
LFVDGEVDCCVEGVSEILTTGVIAVLAFPEVRVANVEDTSHES